MIEKVSDFLRELIEKEKELIKKYEVIDHGPTIGDMYEGLAADILNKTMFKGLDIRVVSGKIRNSYGVFSNEVDCMIVEGEGERIPYTEKFIYNYSQVIAVLEIKKNLYKHELIDSYNKMKKVYSIGDSLVVNMNSFRDSFVSIVKKELPEYKDVEDLSFSEQMIYHSLLIEDTMPVRIVFGYYGYKDEYGLRNGLINILKEGHNAGDNFVFSPVILPDLIISRESSLIKLDGMPYIGSIDPVDGFWHLCASSNNNPLLHLIEFIWTKLSYKYDISSDIFGEDLKIEGLHPLLKAKAVKQGDKTGWEYDYFELSRKKLNHGPVYREWEPHEIDDYQAYILTCLCREGILDINEVGFQNWIKKEAIDLDNMLIDLNKKGLTFLNRNKLTLLTKQCQVLTYGGKWYAADNKSGQFTRWINKKQTEKNEKGFGKV